VDSAAHRNGPPTDSRAEALAVLFRAHYAQLLRTAALLLGDFSAGEDVVQEAFIRVERVARRPDRRHRIPAIVSYPTEDCGPLAFNDIQSATVTPLSMADPLGC